MPHGHRIEGGHRIRLSDYDPGDHNGMEREEVEARVAELGAEMEELHDLLFAASRHSLLLVLQGRDTSGKDGLIRHLLTYINAQSCRVVPFKAPTPIEQAHDFLWRVHAETPGRGSISIFNRSHYEDVLVVRVHDLVPEPVWRQRYDHINRFEELLHDADTIVLKFYLHISKEEQEERLLAREKDPTKSWKLAVGDWKERELWDAYTEAYEELLERCSPPHAPWHIVPANRKWYRNFVVTHTIVEALRPYRKGWNDYLQNLGQQASKELQEYRKGRG